MGNPKRHKKTTSPQTRRQTAASIAGMRIIGGRLGGRRMQYSGDLRTRPMKDRLREAVFNLIGSAIEGKHAIDLFAGTGALAFEALSRDAARATLIEQHHPTAEIIRRNAALLGVEAQTEIVPGNVFIWFRRGCLAATPHDSPWAVFCSPPYDFYIDRAGEMLELISGLIQAAPPESVFAVEADARFDFNTLPDPQSWDVRAYPPAVVGIFRKNAPS